MNQFTANNHCVLKNSYRLKSKIFKDNFEL